MSSFHTHAQQPSNPITDSLSDLASPILDTFDASLETRWVLLDGRRVLLVAAPSISGDGDRDGSTSPVNERAAEIERQLKEIARDVVSGTLPLEVTQTRASETSSLTIITVGDRYLMTVTARDAQVLGADSPRIAAVTMVSNIRRALNRAVEERTSGYLRSAALRASGIAAGVAAVAWLLSSLNRTAGGYLTQQLDGFAEPIPIPTLESTSETDIPADIDEDLEAERAAARQRWRDQKSRLQFRRDFVGLTLHIVRIGAIGAGGLAILNLFPQTRYITTDLLRWFTTFALEVLLIIIATYTAFRLSFLAINGLFSNLSRGQYFKGGTSIRLSSRLKTFSGVLKSLSATVILSIGVLAFLAAININLAPILAGAGLIGLAVSFASQSLVKDVLNGFFILFEDQFSEGDVIATGGVAGVVEDLNLRVTRLRSADGNLIVVPNSTISVVENLTNGFSRANLGIEVAYDTDLDFAIATIKQVANDMASDPEWRSLIVNEPQMLGVDAFGDNSVTIRLWIDTQPLKQWAVAREFRRRLKYSFDRCGISIPFPQRSIWFETPLKTVDKSLNETEIQQLIEQQKRTNGDRTTER
ncbi:MAG: mechanosensitive ion channel family protein [Cyanobacteria bacterium P01_A01_bin.3]